MDAEVDLALDARAFGPRRHAREGDSLVHHVALDAAETPEEIEMPPGAAELAVGNRLEPGLLLLGDRALDLAVLDLGERVGVDLVARAFLARLLQCGGAQQTPDVVGAERRFGALHGRSPFTFRCRPGRREAPIRDP